TFAQREKLGQGINGLDAEFSAALDRLFGLIPPEGDPVDSDGRNILWYLRRFASQAQIETELARHQSIAPALLSNAVSFNIASTFLYRDLRQAFADYLPRVRDINYQNSAGSSLVYLSVSEEARYWALPALLERNP